MAVRRFFALAALFSGACSNAAPADAVTISGAGAGGVPSQEHENIPQPTAAGSAPIPRSSLDASAPAQAGTTAPLPTSDASVPIMPDEADGGRTAEAGPAREDAQTGAPTCPDCCPDGFARDKPVAGARRLFNMTPSPEGVTVCPSGAVFLTTDDGQIWRTSLDGGAPERWAQLSNRQPAGIACDERERLFVAIYGVRSGSGAAGLMRVDGRDQLPVELPQPDEASPFAAYNGVLAIPNVGVYATDSGAGWVVRLREASGGAFSADVVARDILIANGLAYDASGRTLYVASSLGMAVYSFSVAADGSLGDRVQVATKAGAFFDGVAVDELGRVYAADYNGGAVVRLSDSMAIAELTNPASFAFRGGTLLVTDYRLNQPNLEGGLYAIELGACGSLTL